MKTRNITLLLILTLVFACSDYSGDDITFETDKDNFPGKLIINYPLDKTIFPPELPSPEINWDETGGSESWTLKVVSENNSVLFESVTDTNSFRIPAEKWAVIKSELVGKPAKIIILGTENAKPDKIISGSVAEISISKDSVGASVFYRTVPLPFSFAVNHQELIQWRLADISAGTEPDIVMQRLPVCGNCHSFTPDGSKLGMDIDYANDKGSYYIARTKKDMTITDKDIISWSDYRKEDGEKTFGLLSQISPDGKYAVSTVKDRSIFVPVDNLEYSQLFFPIRGILAYYDLEGNKFASLKGADDPDFVQSSPAWTPDGKTIVFAKAPVYYSEAAEKSKKAVLPTNAAKEFLSGEKKFKYDLYAVPFNNGKGGNAKPITGASANGMSNFFPKFSPDGKWMVFCQAESFMLLQGDSRLFILPASDIHNKNAKPRLMNCNMEKMNSWHSWSPNSRWLVFSSKENGAHTGLYLTHIDENGIDSPPVFLEYLTIPGMAANIPEFVNIPSDGINNIKPDYIQYDRYTALRAALKGNRGDIPGALREFKEAIGNEPDNPEYYHKLALAQMEIRAFNKALENLNKAIKLGCSDEEVYYLKGYILNEQEKYTDAIEVFDTLLGKKPKHLMANYEKGLSLYYLERYSEAVPLFSNAIKLSPKGAMAWYMRGISLIQIGDGNYCTDLQKSLDLGFAGAKEAIDEYCK